MLVQEKKLVSELGGQVTEDSNLCTVLVTDKVRRTTKFLSMAAKGAPIVGPEWLKKSGSEKGFQGKTTTPRMCLNIILF